MRRPSRHPRAVWLGFLLLSPLLLLPLPARGQGLDTDGDRIDDATEQALLEAYAPYLHFHPEESYFPVSVQFALDTSVLERYNDSGPPILVDRNPTPHALAALDVPADPRVNPGDVFYLNNTLGSRRDDTGIRAAYEAGTYSQTVYGRVAPAAGETVVQFWFHYAFNPGVWNNHEGDWEVVQLQLSGDAPLQVAYAQHFHGQTMAWADVQREGSHPRVYVAKGSHASYLRPYQGNLGVSGDRVSDQGRVWTPAEYALVNIGERESPTPGNEWLRFAGRWGDFSVEAFARAEAGPPGPAYRGGGQIFGTPVAWAGTLTTPSLLNLGINWMLANIWLVFLGPVGLAVLVTLVRLWRIQRRTGAGVRMWPYLHLRPIDRKSVAMILALSGLTLGVVGFFHPWFQVQVDVDAPGFLVTDGPVDFLEIGGSAGVLINPLKIGEPDVLVAIIPLPLALMFIVLTLYFFLRLAGTTTSRRLGLHFLGRGIILILPFVAVFVLSFFAFFGLLNLDPGGIDPEIILGPVFANPFGGALDLAYQGGTAFVVWGLGLGAWLLLAAAAIMIVAGFLAFSQRYAFFSVEGGGPSGA